MNIHLSTRENVRLSSTIKIFQKKHSIIVSYVISDNYTLLENFQTLFQSNKKIFFNPNSK